MKDLVDRYVRSLLEQEQARDAPEYRQDLGTLVDWLLDRHGFTVHLRTYRHQGPARRQSKGRIQWGRDILATKLDPDGVERGYRFVLKQGDIGQAEWNEARDGSLPNDLFLAAGLHPDIDKMHSSGPLAERWTVVAVHNGDFDTERIGPQRRSLIERIEETFGIAVEWWDAERLVSLTLAPPAEADGKRLEERADPSLLPPGARPFARLALDSLARPVDAGAAFDLVAVDHLIESLLPLADTIEAPRLYRALSELGLFAGMVDVECRTLPQVRGSTLPALDTFERVLCRGLHHGSLLEQTTRRKEQPRIIELLRLLLRHYIELATRLLEHLEPVLDLDHGLAIGSPSERVDYPLRTLRLSGYLATAGAAALDLHDRAIAQRFADALLQLFMKNTGGALSPVLDDQITELALVWDLWRRLEMEDAVRTTARELVARLLFRKNLGLPCPALWIEAGVPLDERGLRILVEAQFSRSAPGFEDGGSLILALALYLGFRGAPAEEADPWLSAFTPRTPVAERTPAVPSGEEEEGTPRVIHPQAWRPPDDASERWYGTRLAGRGTSHVFRLSVSFGEFALEFEGFNAPLPVSSRAFRWGVSAIDRMAWKVFRNPPPMTIFIRPPESPTASPRNVSRRGTRRIASRSRRRGGAGRGLHRRGRGVRGQAGA
jgi:hypothetical protein